LEQLAANHYGNYLDAGTQRSSELDCNAAGEPLDRPGFRRIEIPLTFDAEFFDLLHDDVIHLDSLQIQQQKNVLGGINSLSTNLVRLAQYVSSVFIGAIC
jgi:hypothetical protein